jgi:hypothetical protein
VLLGGTVVNEGAVSAPDGQVVLAAGDAVLLDRGLAGPSGTGTRGYLVGVGGPGRTENGGAVSTPRGNVTLAGGEVVQRGLVTATTGAEAEGSILVGLDAAGARTTFAAGSFTQVLPDQGGKKVVGAGVFERSTVDVFGADIRVLDGATVYAPGGSVTLGKAPRIESAPATAQIPDDVRVYLASGARIDVSGLRDVEVAMEQNTIRAELRASELADNPVLRDGPLRGRTVFYDVRRGVRRPTDASPGVADLAGYENLVERDVAEVMTLGGTIVLQGGEIVAREGSTLDLSGGSVRFRDGYVTSSFLVDPAGRMVRIEDAVAGVPYRGLAGDWTVDHARWGVTETFRGGLSRGRPRFEPGYAEGRPAGTLRVDGNVSAAAGSADVPTPEASPTGAFRILEGTVRADLVVGRYQREVPGAAGAGRKWSERPRGAQLELMRSGHVTIADGPSALPEGFQEGDHPGDALRYRHRLPARWFDGTVFTGAQVASGYTDDRMSTDSRRTVNLAPGGTLVVPEGVTVTLGDGGTFTFTGKQVDIDGTLLAPGGTVTLSALDAVYSGPEPEPPPSHPNRVRVGASGAIDAAGRWTNDVLADGPRRALDGGAVTLEGVEVVLERGSRVDVSSGARLEAKRSVTGGSGGRIALDAGKSLNPPDAARGATGGLVLEGTLAGYGARSGGALLLAVPSEVVIADALPGGAEPGAYLIAPGFFTRNGFASYDVTGGRSLTVRSGTVVAPSVEALFAPTLPAEIPGGVRFVDLADRRLRPEGRRDPMTLRLSTRPAESLAGLSPAVTLEVGAEIRMEPGSTVSLTSLGLLDVGGRILAPGGAITLRATGTPASLDILPRLTVGPSAELSVAGWVRSSLDRDLVRRSVEPGGTLTLAVESGQPSRWGDGLRIEPGAVLDASGTQGLADLLSAPAAAGGRYQERWVEGAGGRIVIRADYGGEVLGTLRLGPGGASARGGRLEIAGSGGTLLLGGGSAPDPDALALSVDVLNAAAADDLRLEGSVRFDGSVALRTRRSLSLSAAQLGTTAAGAGSAVRLESGHVVLDGGGVVALPSLGGAPAASSLAIAARLIDVSDTVLLGCPDGSCGGFGAAELSAGGDIRLSAGNTPAPGLVSAGVLSAGAITFDAAQVYVTSRTRGGAMERAAADPGFLVASGTGIFVKANGGAAPVPLSFGERLTLRAPIVEQGGVLRAPSGQIRLEGPGGAAGGKVILLPGSLTSASLEGATVLYGDVERQGFAGYASPGSAPAKAVELRAQDVDVQAGATVDVSGGGDLLGYAFLEGNGGSRDVLASEEAFAILPGRIGNGFAPLDGAPELANGKLGVGDSISLKGVPGLADGTYTLLPARYALLEGGLLVRPLGRSTATLLSTAPEAFVAPDGSIVAAGRRTVSGTSIEAPGWERFQVLDRAAFGAHSELVTTSFDATARALAGEAGVGVRTPADAGGVVLDASGTLALHGAGRFAAPQGRLLGTFDVAAERIAVVGPGVAGPAGYLTLEVDALNRFGAGSLLLGGTRAAGAAGTSVSVKATDVKVDTAGAGWVGPEIILAATGEVSIAGGSLIRAEGQRPGDANALLLAGDGALLRVSSGERVGIVRSGSSGAAGTLRVGAATLASDGSLALDAAHSIDLAPGGSLRASQLDLATTRVLLGDAPAGEPGTRLDSVLVTALGASRDLAIRGHESIRIFRRADGELLVVGGRDDAGARLLERLTLDTGLLQADGLAAAARIDAGLFTLRNGGQAPAAGASGSGALELEVDRLVLGDAANGVRSAALRGTAGLIEARGSGALEVAGSLALQTSRITASSGVAYRLTAAGAISLSRGSLPAPAEPASGLGGRLEVAASTVDLDTNVALPAGRFEADATGGALRIGTAGVIDVRGAERVFGEVSRYAPGGHVQLAASGDVEIAAGALLDVSGAEGGGDAGRVEISAGGGAALAGTIRGRAAGGWGGGAFALDAATLGSFTALNRELEAGGLDDTREVRLRQQGIALEAGERLRAHRVRLRSDGAAVTVAGEIDASGGGARLEGGRVELAAAGDVTLAGTARIDARAGQAPPGGFEPSSGGVALVSAGGSVAVEAGASLDVSGGRQGGGEIVVRAPRAGNDLAVAVLAGEIQGARRLVLQGSRAYTAAAIDVTPGALDPGVLVADASAWLSAGAAAIRARLGASAWVVAPAMQVESDGDLAVRTSLDLSPLASPGHLELRARGAVTFAAGTALSDGFSSAARSATLLDQESFGYGIEAGGDVTLAPGATVRTGTGDVGIRARGSLVLEAATSVVYTAGRRTAAAPGFAPAQGKPLGDFPTDGGDLEIEVAGDVRAALPTQTTSAWLFRQGGGDAQTAWSVVHRNFEQGVGALGGGDVRVAAGGDVVQLDVAIPTTGHVTAPMAELAEAGDRAVLDHAGLPSLELRGGGDLEVRAGGDVRGGLFMLGRGHAAVSAGGAIRKSDVAVGSRLSHGSSALGPDARIGVLFGLMDATARVTAGSAVDLQAAFDPARQGQIAEDLAGGAGTAFWGYTERTALDVTSLAGDVRYANDPWASVDPSTKSGLDPRWRVAMAGTRESDLNIVFRRAPPTLRLGSLEAAVPLAQRFGNQTPLLLAPAARGTLELLAGTEVRIGFSVTMEDVAPQYGHGPLAPWGVTGGSVTTEAADPTNNFLRGTGPIHAGDPEPARIHALAGSVCAYVNGACTRKAAFQQQATVTLPKPLEVLAGVDVVAGDYQPQHASADQLSSISAGRDVREVGLQVMGPGTAALQAGRDVVFQVVANSVENVQGGLVLAKGDNTRPSTTAARPNPALPPDAAADLVILAGAAGGLDYETFASAYLDPENGRGVVRTYLPELREYLARLGYGDALSEAEQVRAFASLPELRRRVFLDRIYFAELKQTGIDYNDAESERYRSYERGFRAVDLLFPGGHDRAVGSVILNGKPVETQADGDITILAPYGRVQVGNPGLNTSAANTGVLTRRGGAVRIMAHGNVDLETSRVFTLQGGDVTMWTSRGDITAGTGSKTGVFQTPLSYQMTNDGVVSLNAFGISTGAGIGVLDALQSGESPRSRMDLIAPEGEVNAGDAGIRVAGDLNIAAAVVVGMENIQVSGASAGVPSVEPPNTVALTTASAVAQAATKEGVGPAAQPRQAAEDLPSIITVEVVGYEKEGEDGGEAEARRKRGDRRPEGGR